jgi:hypothetical protein
MSRLRRTPVEAPSDLPSALIDEVIEAMAALMSGTPEAQRCDGLSFAFTVTDQPVLPARYEVSRRGRVLLTRDDPTPASFHFSGTVSVFDAVLSGSSNPLAALLRRRIHLQGSLAHVRQLLRMMPSVHRAYGDARADMLDRWSDRYDFRF